MNLALGKKDPQPRKAGEKDYNFHWTHTGDIWCSDGMFGQTCAIIPEQNMVIAITTADSNYLETELIQKEILDPMKEERNFAEKIPSGLSPQLNFSRPIYGASSSSIN